MNLMRFVAMAAIVVVVSLGHRAAGNATILGNPVLLSDLLPLGTTLDVGDKEFSEFTYFATEDMPAADAINVIPIQDLNGHLGLRFQGAQARRIAYLHVRPILSTGSDGAARPASYISVGTCLLDARGPVRAAVAAHREYVLETALMVRKGQIRGRLDRRRMPERGQR